MSTNLFNPSDRRSYPSRWPFYRGKQLFRVIDERSEDGSEELLSVSHITGITPRSQKNVTMFKSESLVGYKICQIGDIAANTMWTWQGAIGVASYNGVVSPAYNVYRQIKDIYNPHFLDLFLRERSMIDVYHSLSTGIRPSRLRLYPDVFLTIQFPVPPREEQEQIVKFLDWKVSEVNRLIKMINQENELLKEIIDNQFKRVKQQSLIRLKRCVTLENKYINLDADKFYKKTGMYNRGRGIFRREPVRGSDMGDSLFQKISSNRVMISGQFAWEGAAYITTESDEEGVASHRYYFLTPNEGVSVEYIWAFLMSDVGQMEMKKCSHGAAGRNRPLNIKELLNVNIPEPKDDENLIFLKKAVRAYMNFQSVYKKKIELLQEYKTRLISDVVTGQIDVRDIDVPEYEIAGENSIPDFDGEEISEEPADEEVS